MYRIYKPSRELDNEMIVRVEDNAWIPMDESNMDYQAYLAWLEAGNTPEEWNPNGNN